MGQVYQATERRGKIGCGKMMSVTATARHNTLICGGRSFPEV